MAEKHFIRSVGHTKRAPQGRDYPAHEELEDRNGVIWMNSLEGWMMARHIFKNGYSIVLPSIATLRKYWEIKGRINHKIGTWRLGSDRVRAGYDDYMPVFTFDQMTVLDMNYSGDLYDELALLGTLSFFVFRRGTGMGRLERLGSKQGISMFIPVTSYHIATCKAATNRLPCPPGTSPSE